MSKKDCQLNHSRNLSTSYVKDNYFYDIERSKATAKQIKFYRSLWYKFKDNGIDINTELDKRGIKHWVVQQPSGRSEYSQAIDTMIEILSDLGLYEQSHEKQEKSAKFTPTYNVVCGVGGRITRSYQKIEYSEESEGSNGTNI